MSLELRQGLRQEQRLALLPQMLQSIEVLQLATADLLTMLDHELQQNETLEAKTPPPIEPPAPPPQPVAEREDSGWEEWRRGPAGDDEDKKGQFLANVAAQPVSLVEHVRQQLAYEGVPALLADAVVKLTEHLDERGLLAFPLAELAQELDVPIELLREAHDVLRTLEPRGIGASDPIEAMLLQAAADPDLPLIERLLREHLEELGRNKLPDVARALRLSVDELRDLLARMRELNPRPGAGFAGDDAGSLHPDAYAWLHDGVVQVALDDASLPDLQVNAEYAALAADRGTDRQLRDYLRPKLRSARDLIDAVQQRQATLLRVTEAVMREQKAFLQKGRASIRPLRMSDIAAQVGMHTSTVSRAIAGKSVQTDRGVFRLRDFFDGSRIDSLAGEGQGRMALAEQIAELVAAEDKTAPLSDDDLVARLAARGVQCARRTITKYRKQLGIPSSYLRRRFGDPT
ncbi:MAG: RNA polymerase factor sigma-54 [Planctomycetota bacterium]|jgi:RNA polymerase sigma-54 factor